MSFQKVILVGRLGQKPHFKEIPSGSSVCNLSVATNEAWTDKSGKKEERTEWHKVTVWGKLAEFCAQRLDKGSQVFVEGRIQTRSWKDKEGRDQYSTEIQAQSVRFFDKDKTSHEPEHKPASEEELEDDIPF